MTVGKMTAIKGEGRKSIVVQISGSFLKVMMSWKMSLMAHAFVIIM